MNRFAFNCPNSQCSSQKLEEVMVDVTVTSEVTVIGGEEVLQYGKQTNLDGYVVRYQCMKCGQHIANNEDELFKSKALSPNEKENSR